MIPREVARPEEEDVRGLSVARENGSSAPGENGDATAPALRGDLTRTLRILLDGPLPRVWIAENAGVSSRAAGRMLDLLLEEGIVVVRRPSPWSAGDVVEYPPGVGRTVHRVLTGAGEKAGPSDNRSELPTQGEVEIFARLLGLLVRLDLSARERRQDRGERT